MAFGRRIVVATEVEDASPTTPMKMSEKFSKFVIEARCTDNILFSACMTVGSLVLMLQTFPVFMNDWVLLTEPRTINKTNENGEQIETTFHYNTGYFQLCRRRIYNFSGVSYDEMEIPEGEKMYKCHLNPLLTHNDITEFSIASLAVIVRLGPPALLHITGSFICCLAFVLGIVGHWRRTISTLFSCISYIIGSVVLCTAVLMVVCVVDDELAPRMKPNAAGEPSQFSYKYGYPFFSTALSFLPVHVCACFHAFLYFRRYPSVAEKLKYVPGLEAKLRHAQLDKELGIPPAECWRRGSLASYLPIPTFGVQSRRNSRKSSLASYSTSNLLFVQEL